ncbi:carboxylesterase/lipase family protein [Streptomyces pseudovenezuelae]|uniref:carboxylesterase/lipase family protein n=1 Tax=Streptomyces pseudovenezuelae TaxID=67350 RepID=UPI00380E5EBC
MPKRRSTAGAALGAALLLTVMGTADAVQTSPTTAAQHPHRQHAQGQHSEARPDTARTRQGLLEGLTAGGVTIYQGIPYAAPPVGPLRWQPPAAPPTRTSTRTAAEPGPACAQPEVADSAEDCLYLNVTTPADGADRKAPRPVVVWLHGGAFSSGSGDQYDATRMARQGDVTVVTVNSRLGALGFFAHPDLPDSGAFGLQDQQAALRWVRDNAAAFGGDPGNVTLMGESSGGASVCAQLASPKAAGLFHRAVIQSGSCLQNWPKNTLAPGDPAATYFAPQGELAAKGRGALGCRSLKCLRAKPVKDVLSLNGRFHQPAYGTSVLPQSPARALAAGHVHRVPVLQGNTRDEHRLFTALFTLDGPMTAADYRRLLTETYGRRQAARIARVYSPGAMPALAWAEVGTDRSWVCPTLAADRLLARHVPVYSYEFADRHPPAPDLHPDFPLGAYHSAELPYLFGMGDLQLNGGQSALSRRMIAAWTTFARAGTPGDNWPPFPYTQQLARHALSGVDAAAEHHCAFWSRTP